MLTRRVAVFVARFGRKNRSPCPTKQLPSRFPSRTLPRFSALTFSSLSATEVKMEPNTVTLEKAQFNETVPVKAVEFSNIRFTQGLRHAFGDVAFDRNDLKNFRPFVKLPDGKFRIFLKQDVKGLTDLSEKQQKLLEESQASLVGCNVELTFDNFTQEAILHRLLPQFDEITTKFEQVGHIAHINLQTHLLSHKYLIGTVLLEKNRDMGIRTVVNKTTFIENQFRVLPMEVIAGPDETMVELQENNCTFRFDFREVFWNSRLLNEHHRIVRLCQPDDVIMDMCAGVGPFAVPLARRGCTVYANDLNPACFKYLNENADLNLGKRRRNNLRTYNMDGREFVRQVVEMLEQRPNPEVSRRVDHVLINLPASAPEFLDVFRGLFGEKWDLPRIHVYCFAIGEENSEEVRVAALTKIAAGLGVEISFLDDPAWELEALKIRQTATATTEFCVSFKLHPQVGLRKQ